MIELKKSKTIRLTTTLISRIEKYANERSLTFTSAVIQLILKGLDKDKK